MATTTTPGSLSLSELEHTFGVLFVGYVVAMVGYGFTFFQTYVYYSRYPKDHWAVKSTVAAVCAIDTATSALISQALYYYLVRLFPYTTGLVDATKTFCAEIGLAVLGVYIVQMYYAVRVWTLSKNAAVAGIIGTISTAAFALGIAMTVEMFENTAFAHLAADNVKAIVASCQALTFASGLLTFCALTFYLRPSRTPGLKPIEGWFDKLVTYTITRGSAATVVQLGYFIVFIATPSQQYWMPFHLVASKLFINSLLTMLNSREAFRGQGINEEESVSSQRKNAGTAFSTSGGRSNPGVRFNVVESKPPINIEVSRTVEHDNSGKINFDYEDGNSLNDPLASGNKKDAMAV